MVSLCGCFASDAGFAPRMQKKIRDETKWDLTRLAS
jgi:hypothetical protein